MNIEKLAQIMEHLKLHLTILGNPFIKDEPEVHI